MQLTKQRIDQRGQNKTKQKPPEEKQSTKPTANNSKGPKAKELEKQDTKADTSGGGATEQKPQEKSPKAKPNRSKTRKKTKRQKNNSRENSSTRPWNSQVRNKQRHQQNQMGKLRQAQITQHHQGRLRPRADAVEQGEDRGTREHQIRVSNPSTMT
ncbi:hypothetical protein U1Q18_047072 [Sarracenia purpurea var. burkii]